MMAARPVMMVGVLYPLNKMDPPVPCYFYGNAWDPSLSIGGGPIIPPEQPPVGGPPGQPIHPIWGPPGFVPPGPGMPPGIWGGPIIPPDQPPVGGGPPGVPTFPIWGPPGISLPPGSGYPPVAGHPLPTPPDQPPSAPILGWEAKAIWTA